MRENIGNYSVLREIGRGAMGRVYLSYDEVIKRNVAVKELVLPDGLSPEEIEDAFERFTREAQAAGGLSHPNIVTVYGVEKADGTPFIVMEFLEGITLHKALQEGAMEPERAMDIACQICDALAYAHDHDIAHRDVKPDNIFLLFDGRAKITDFGIARIMSSSTMTRVGTVMGSPGYMSPEQVRGEKTDWRTDIFSTGALLYEMLTGVNPFLSDSLPSAMYKVVHDQPRPLSDHDSSLPSHLQAVVDRTLAKKKEDRYQDIREMKEDLEKIKASPETAAAVSPPTVVVPPPSPPTIKTQAPLPQVGVETTAITAAPAAPGLPPDQAVSAAAAGEMTAPGIPGLEKPARKRGKLWLVVVLSLLIAGGAAIGLVFAFKGDGGATITFQKVFGGKLDDAFMSVGETADGGYILGGKALSSDSGKSDALVVKTDAQGNLVWDSACGGEKDDAATSVQQTSDGGYAVAVFTPPSSGGENDARMIKVDSRGSQFWDRTYGGEVAYLSNSVQQTSGGGYILAGYTESSDKAGDGFLIKTDVDGEELWRQDYGGENTDRFSTAVQTSDGGYAMAGYTQSSDSDMRDAWLVKTDSEGTQLWSHTYGGTKSDLASSLQQTSDGGYILAGYTDSMGEGRDAWIVKTDDDGNELWSRNYGGPESDSAKSVVQTSDGGYALAGQSDSYGEGGDGWLVKTDGDGEYMWSEVYGGDYEDGFNSLRQTPDGGYILAGYTVSFGSGMRDAWLLKTDGEGITAVNPETMAVAWEEPDGEEEETGEEPQPEPEPQPAKPQPEAPAPQPEPAPVPQDDGWTMTDYDYGYNTGFAEGHSMGYSDYYAGTPYYSEPFDAVGPNEEYIFGYIDGYREGYDSGWYEAWSEDEQIYTPSE
ncbi:MAG: protein kinase [Actinomycetota bacterium]|nr:protein kinase [Actinomycetota bacterium]